MSVYTVRGIDRQALHQLKNYASQHKLKMGTALSMLIRKALEKEGQGKKKYNLADYKKFLFKGGKDLSKMVDEIAYGEI